MNDEGEKGCKAGNDSTLAGVTQRLIRHILGLSFEERRRLLAHLEAVEGVPLKDQRKSPRILYSAEVDFLVDDRPFRGMILDISEEGARIAACDIPPAGAEVRMAFPLPGREHTYVRMTGIVVRDADMDFGVSFSKGLNPNLKRYDLKILGSSSLKKDL
ncbi:PilZ domain-containing protein [Desulfobotulus sp. H1]|uniref:PilZ domain-containing protein n=1 Tax=Desulfobotulus pelophilus TaxID=2823377 RepID=A0ABT3N6K2_9BACT|nr:PilZ domain-containing protein [Desulfobotulus pelophilus]MCW7753095.1 PilZ domain-containing protein [Desulfobotulus pelophilus]